MAIKPSHILGMNGRFFYTKLNPGSAKSYGFSKLRTKDLLNAHGIATAQVYHVFSASTNIEEIKWENIPVPFVVKPASGSAGKGIVLIKKKVPDKKEWLNFDGHTVAEEDLNYHIVNILQGEFSTWGSDHKAIVEELIPSHPTLAKFAYKGTPDIRVIVFNSVPVMAMTRIPTQASEGKANLDLGAIGLGIDMATGITTYAVQGKSGHITHFPGTKKKVNGIRIPNWNAVLETAVKAANAAGFHYMGADLFIHPDKGPMIVELNGYPGLSIQLCNRAGLKRRLERVEDIDVRDAKHGVKIAQALFAESFADQITAEEGIQIIPYRPTIDVFGDTKQKETITALVNTSKFRSAISQKLATDLGLLDLEDLLWQQVESQEGKVPVVEVEFRLKGKKNTTAMVVTKRLNKTSYKVELGRKDLESYLIGDLSED